jgi:hypothetical protein
MPDTSSSFEHSLEADMQKLAAEIRSQRERPEMKNAAEKELLKEAIRVFPDLSKEAPATSTTAANATTSSGVLPAYAANAPAEVKLEIEYLLDVALRSGLSKAIAESKKSPYFVQDAFHDALAGRLYPELQKRELIK